MVAPRFERRDGVLGEEVRRAAPIGDLPRRRLGAFLAELKRVRLRGLGPGAAHTGESIGLVLMGEDAAAAEGHVLASKATAERLDRTPPPGRVGGSSELGGGFHRKNARYERVPIRLTPQASLGSGSGSRPRVVGTTLLRPCYATAIPPGEFPMPKAAKTLDELFYDRSRTSFTRRERF
jgi:hypothetical protein